ncbi:penicillin-binding protein activator, partial [Blastomonas sp.]|uniref:penicillin-binding protein activator n=1 Tax=Blastomonas sp. TaxID=1909299 RepID=UPI003593CA36
MKQAYRRLLGIVMLVLGTAFLAACQTMVPKTAPPPPPVQTPVDPVDRPADRPITGVLPSDDARHRIALLLPLSGKDAAVGQSLANATTLALLDTKANNIRITSYDTARGAQAAAQRAIADGNRLILGPLLSDDVVAIAATARAANVPIISYSNDTGIAGDNVFIMGYVPAQSIDRVIRHARAQGITRFAGLVPAGTYGQRASSAMLAAVNRVGGTVVSMQTYAAGNAAITTAVRRMQQESAYEAILIADSGAAAIRIVPMVRANGGGTARILGTELWNTERALPGSAAMRGAWFASVSDGLYRQYATKYRSQFGGDPFRLSTLGYDSVLLTTRIARDWRIGSPFPVDKLRDPGGFIGLDGAFRFGRNGIAERLLEVQQVGAGQLTIAAPAPKSF